MSTSAFTECIVVATVIGRALCHRQQSMVDTLYLNESRDFWQRQEWINATLTQRMGVFSLNYPVALQDADPMLLFIGMMWHTTVLYMYQILKSVIHPTEEKMTVLADYTRQSTMAAKEIVGLTNKLSQLNSFKVSRMPVLSMFFPTATHVKDALLRSLKVHPLTPIPLSLCAEFFVSCHELGDTYNKQLQNIIEAMHGLMSFSNLTPGLGAYPR